jgi:hypothetical protein
MRILNAVRATSWARAKKPRRADPTLAEITASIMELPDHFAPAATLRAAGLRTWAAVFAAPRKVLARLPGVDADAFRALTPFAPPRPRGVGG